MSDRAQRSNRPIRRTRVRRILASTFLVTILAGCAVKMPRVDLYPQMPESLPADAPRVSAEGLGLIPLMDRRPELEREGQSPSLWVFLLYNQRRGSYVTSDDNFEVPVSQSVTNALAAALDGSRLGSAWVLGTVPNASAQAALERCSDDNLRYVAAGSIDSLYGITEQDAYLAIIPLPYISFIGWRNSVSDSLGVISLDLEILECATGRRVYKRRISRQLRYPEESPPNAVRLTLHDMLEQIRNEASGL